MLDEVDDEYSIDFDQLEIDEQGDDEIEAVLEQEVTEQQILEVDDDERKQYLLLDEQVVVV